MVGLAVLLLIVALTVSVPFIAQHDPETMHFEDTFVAPGTRYFFGTDDFGRDMLSRTLTGYRVSLAVAFLSVALACILSMPIGLAVGFFGGAVDTVFMRALDVLMAFPPIVLAIVFVAIFGTGTHVLVLAIGVVFVPILTRVIRASVLEERTQLYVEAAHSLGASNARMMLYHVLPNSLGPAIVQASTLLGLAILIEASLSYLGLGLQPPTPSLGRILAEGRRFMQQAPWVVLFPGLAIGLAVTAFNLLGDGLQEMLNPSQRAK